MPTFANLLGSITLLMSAWVGLSAECAEPTVKSAGPAGDWELMRNIVPRHYLCHATGAPLKIDGLAAEPAWQAAAWTDEFVDIVGDRKPKPKYRTRAKMLWDDNYLYVHAELEEPHVWATITKKNSVIFRDNDFEVFIGPDGSNHHYHEFEMNALNTIWELSLDKPYRNRGPVHDPDNMPGLRSAVNISGTINDPRDTDKGWSVTIAFPWKDLKKYAGSMACPPNESDTWRIGFSRVEWLIDVVAGKYHKLDHPEDNWIWSPQGIVDMHAPERWGFVQFTRKPQGEGKFVPLADWKARETLMEVYHRQQEFKRVHGNYAASLNELSQNVTNTLGLPSDDQYFKMQLTKDGFTAEKIVRTDKGWLKLSTRDDSWLGQVIHEQKDR
jgi:hypothetical protein